MQLSSTTAVFETFRVPGILSRTFYFICYMALGGSGSCSQEHRSSGICLECSLQMRRAPTPIPIPSSIKLTISLKAVGGVRKLRTGLGAEAGLEPHLHHRVSLDTFNLRASVYSAIKFRIVI